MNIDLIAPEVIQRLAGSLLHFVWQGAVIALLTAVGLRLLRHRSAEARYAFAIVSLVCIPHVSILMSCSLRVCGCLLDGEL